MKSIHSFIIGLGLVLGLGLGLVLGLGCMYNILQLGSGSTHLTYILCYLNQIILHISFLQLGSGSTHLTYILCYLNQFVMLPKSISVKYQLFAAW